MEDYNNPDEEIILLKNNLMSSYPYSHKSVNSREISDSILQHENEKIGRFFEDNIREVIQAKLGLKPAEFSRVFRYREINIGQSTNIKIVSLNFPQDVEYNSQIYTITMNENGSLSLLNKNNTNKTPTLIDANKEIKTKERNIEIFISKLKKFEMDGAFQLKNFDLKLFDQKEISILHYGINKNEEKDFEYIVIEAKLSNNKATEMIKQLKRDKFYLSKMTNKKILYCGFVNSNELIHDISYTLSDLSCIIIGLKSYFFGMDMTKFYNWPFINNTNKELAELKSQVRGLEDRVGGLENRVGALENRVGALEKSMQDLIKEVKTMNSNINLLLAKKRKKKENEDDDKDDKDDNFLKKKTKHDNFDS